MQLLVAHLPSWEHLIFDSPRSESQEYVSLGLRLESANVCLSDWRTFSPTMRTLQSTLWKLSGIPTRWGCLTIARPRGAFFPPRILLPILRKFIQGYRDVSWAYVWNEKGLISIRGRCRTKAATGNCSRAAADNSEMGVCIHCIHLKALPYNEDCVEEAFISWGDRVFLCVFNVILLSAWVFSMQYGPLPQSKHIQVNLRILPLGVSVSVTVVCVFARGLSRVYPWLHPVSAGHRHKKVPWHC